jgi:hypothetical protein
VVAGLRRALARHVHAARQVQAVVLSGAERKTGNDPKRLRGALEAAEPLGDLVELLFGEVSERRVADVVRESRRLDRLDVKDLRKRLAGPLGPLALSDSARRRATCATFSECVRRLWNVAPISVEATWVIPERRRNAEEYRTRSRSRAVSLRAVGGLSL